MTKEEIRHVSICKLHLKSDSVLYDVGSGTGSIAVEAASLSNDMEVYAIEQKENAVQLITQNKKKHGLENIHVINAKAPDGMENLPVPTHAFIGGSSGNLKEIIKALKEKNPYEVYKEDQEKAKLRDEAVRQLASEGIYPKEEFVNGDIKSSGLNQDAYEQAVTEKMASLSGSIKR